MKEITIDSLESFLSELYIYADFDCFRGQSSVDYRLIPSIGRLYRPDRESSLLQFEKEIFDDFKRKYSLFTDVRPRNDMEFLFLAQHYGLPTRLLDWTFNPAIALYFACISSKEKDGVVFHYVPRSYKHFDPSRDDVFSFPHMTNLRPVFTDVRYKNQNGLFFLYPRPWEENLEDIYEKFIIRASAKSPILAKLEKIGITRTFIMPLLDSLCAEIMDLHSKRYPYLGFQ